MYLGRARESSEVRLGLGTRKMVHDIADTANSPAAKWMAAIPVAGFWAFTCNYIHYERLGGIIRKNKDGLACSQ